LLQFLGRVLRWLILAPIFCLAVLIATANRDPILISLDPFDPHDPAYGFVLPVYVIIFASLLLGLALGLGAASLSGRKRV
jgi:hypothetical protein